MAQTVVQQLHDRLWAILEADSDFTALIKVGNRIKQTNAGWLRATIAAAPNDWKQLTITSGKFRHSLFTAATGFASEDPDLTEGDCDFDVIRAEELVITIRSELTATAGASEVREALVQALINSTPQAARLGLPSLVTAIGEITGEERDTREGEKPYPGRITTLRLPIATQQSGLSLIA